MSQKFVLPDVKRAVFYRAPVFSQLLTTVVPVSDYVRVTLVRRCDNLTVTHILGEKPLLNAKTGVY